MSRGPGETMNTVLRYLYEQRQDGGPGVTPGVTPLHEIAVFGVISKYLPNHEPDQPSWVQPTGTQLASIRRALRSLAELGYVITRIERLRIGIREHDNSPIWSTELVAEITPAGTAYLEKRWSEWR